MKKIIGILLAIMLCMALAAPAFAEVDAENVYRVHGTDIIYLQEDVNFEGLIFEGTGDLWIYGNFNLNDGADLRLCDGTIKLMPGASLTGSNIAFYALPSCHILLAGGKIDLSFSDSVDTDAFANILKSYDISYARFGNRIVAPCPHENQGYAYHCKDCGAALTAPTSSTLSEGSVTVIIGVAGASVGFLAALFVFRKKKIEERVES